MNGNHRASHTRRSFLRGFSFTAVGAPLLAYGANVVSPARTPRIGYYGTTNPPYLMNAFLEELRAQGFSDGDNVIVEKSDSAEKAKAMPGMELSFIVAGSLPSALLVRNANPNMPMVIATCPGMVSNGFARSLAQPGGIYTGLDELPPGVTARRVELLKTAAPSVKRIALLSTTPGVGGHEKQHEDAQTAAQRLHMTVKVYRAPTIGDVDGALAAIASDGMDGMLNFQGAVSIFKRQAIVDFAAEHRLPAIYQATMFAEAGGLMTWAPDLAEQYREAARYAATILRGSKPGELPAKYPAKYFLTLNAGAANKIGLSFPATLLAEASRVI
ncbi:MAG TPA: ABC transporter substrate-binding protein [Steroidobacteraceae bacterium]|nr:ABC transporter substrate-binding protein [Steroidobacteraceae bacterium]